MENLRERLIKSYKSGNFFEAIYNESIKETESLGKQVALLHNEGHIDVVAEFLNLSNNGEEIDFFTTRSVFEEALPLINTSVLPVMECVKHLIDVAGNDMAANMVLKPFIEYCEKDFNRSKAIIQIIENHSEEWIDFLAPAIIAGTNLRLQEFLEIAIKLLKNKNLNIRQKVTFALGRINYCNKKEHIEVSFNALEYIITSEKDENIIAIAIKSLFSLYVADNSLENKVTELIQTSLHNQSNLTLYAVSELFGFNTDNIPPNLLNVFIDSLKNASPSDRGIFKNIDRGLKHLKKSNKEDKVFSLLEHLLIQNKSDISINTFELLSRELRKNNTVLSQIATRWFLSKKVALCKSVLDIVRLGHGSDILFVADYEQIQNQDSNTHIYVARKAIGWLYTNPISCISFIISLIDYADQIEIEKMTYLLFDPMIISYPGKVRKYLEDIKPNSSMKVQSVIENVLQLWESYLDGIRTADVLPELLPSENHKAMYSKSLSREMEKVFKENQKDYFFHQLFTKTILLYGRKSIFYSKYLNDEPNRMEIPLQNISHSMEFPRLDTLDPHGLDYTLRIFRIENCKS